MYKESGSENKNIEENGKGENEKNVKELSNTNINRHKKGKQTKEMAFSNLGKNIFIGDSAATSHMTSNKMGVYNLIPINGSVIIGNGQSISCTHKGQLDVICKHKDGSMAKETWDVKIVPQLNHDLFSFTKAMKEGW